MRVHELAKELGLTSKDLIAKLEAMGVSVKSHMSTIDDSVADAIRGGSSAPARPAAEPTPEPAAKPAAKAAEPAAKPATKAAEPTAKPAAKAAEPAPKAAPAPKAESTAPASRPVVPKPAAPVTAADDKILKAKGGMLVRELAEALGVRPNQLITELMRMNMLVSINERLDLTVIKKLAEKHGFEVEQEKRSAEHYPAPKRRGETDEAEAEDRPEDMVSRPPVVTFLGHVDHGKTSLLDRIRNTRVTDGESGGITQHIGAYTVEMNGKPITFLDTPGHAAFTAMRARGANMTDIAVIIIAADDGIMPQTREAIKHAQAAGVSLMVAVNKIDLPQARLDRVMQQLQAEGLAPEDWGGETICCPVSAHTGEGLDHLLEMILLQAEVLELKANASRRADGFVIEARLEPGMGPTANLLVKRGTLKLGDIILCGSHYGRVRALIGDTGAKLKSAGPSMPVKCLGLSGVVEAGALFRVCANEKAARSLAEAEASRVKAEQLSAPRKASLDDLLSGLGSGDKLELKVVIKADTQGSIEAIVHSLQEIKSDKVSLNIILSGIGNITENDVMLASASDAVILGFHVMKENGVDAAAKHEGVEIRLHQIIYELLDQVREAMTGLLMPEKREKVTGHAEVRRVFAMGKRTRVAGCLVMDGYIKARSRIRVQREGAVLFDGRIESLRHFQDEAAQVREAQECGIRIEGYNDFAEGDRLECYEVEEVEQTL